MTDTTTTAADEKRLPFTEHLHELRKRLIACVVAVFLGFIISYNFAEQLFQILCKPWLEALPKDQTVKLIATAPHEAFFTYMKVSFIAGVGLAVPVMLFHIWRFIAPGLYEHEKRALIPVVFFSSFFFLGGALFGYFCVFPYGFRFFASFATDYITPMITTREFLRFSTKLLLGFGIVFELPIFAFFLAKLGLITAPLMRRMRKVAVVVIFIVAAALTPGPDVFSQLMMAGPLLILYEISVWIVHIFGRKSKPEPTGEKKGEALPS
ncbi:MAG: twin-arginine translocase subunit TatC [Deltaproteobacteria bacterium]|jgi:sec-independent protein translocase protein TatC|nr:twin-arginine translocase subunit TatC [Deltaproteobacteria bacterium]